MLFMPVCNHPKVSVIVNCFNGSRFLKQALDSIYAQTFQDWEIIFFDNNSTDGSIEIARSYDSRIKIYPHSYTIPLGEARQLAIENAQGNWISFLDTDDLWLPQNLEIQLGLLEGSDFVLSYAGIMEMTEDESLIRVSLPAHQSGYIFPNLLTNFDINMVTPLILRQFIFEKKLSFNPEMTASEEYNLFMRIAAQGNICCVPHCLGKYRVSASSLTYRQMSRWAIERRITLAQIKSENIGIENRYKSQFEQAYIRADYYEAVSLMRQNRYFDARRIMTKYKLVSKIYFFLYIAVCFPFLWQIVHDPKIKRRLSKFLTI